MNTGCEFFEEALVEHAAGRLDGERARRLDRHLAGCQDCRETLEVVQAVRRHPVSIPDGLQTTIRESVRTAVEGPGAGVPEPGAAAGVPGGRAGDRVSGRRFRAPGWAWGLPLAAAAALALWLGVGIGDPGSGGADDLANAGSEAVDPFGAWPASDGTVAGDPLLSELTEEELERLLEEMES